MQLTKCLCLNRELILMKNKISLSRIKHFSILQTKQHPNIRHWQPELTQTFKMIVVLDL